MYSSIFDPNKNPNRDQILLETPGMDYMDPDHDNELMIPRPTVESRRFPSPARVRFRPLLYMDEQIDQSQLLRRPEIITYAARIGRRQRPYMEGGFCALMVGQDFVRIFVDNDEYKEKLDKELLFWDLRLTSRIEIRKSFLTQIAWRPFGPAGSSQFCNVLCVPNGKNGWRSFFCRKGRDGALHSYVTRMEEI